MTVTSFRNTSFEWSPANVTTRDLEVGDEIAIYKSGRYSNTTTYKNATVTRVLKKQFEVEFTIQQLTQDDLGGPHKNVEVRIKFGREYGHQVGMGSGRSSMFRDEWHITTREFAAEAIARDAEENAEKNKGKAVKKILEQFASQVGDSPEARAKIIENLRNAANAIATI